MNKDKWRWTPNTSLGVFNFDKSFKENLIFDKAELIKHPSEPDDWATYSLNEEGLSFSIKDDILESVECYKCFYYKDRNLIGMTVTKGLRLFEDFYTFSIEDCWEDGYEMSCDELGIILWIEGDLIESVSVSS